MRVAIWTATVAVIAYLAFVGGGYPGINLPALRMTSLVLVILVLSAWVLAMLRSARWRPQTALLPAMLALVGTFVTSTVLSRSPRLSAESGAFLVLTLSLYLLLQRLFSDDFFRQRLVTVARVVCLVMSAAYLAGAGAQWLEWWSTIGRVAAPPMRPGYASLTLGNPNPVAFVVVTLMATGLAGLGWRSGGRGYVLAGAIALPIAAAVVSGSRLIWIAIALSSVATFGVWAVVNRRFQFTRPKKISRLSLLLLGATAMLAIVAAPGISARVADGGGSDLRVSYLAVSARMFAESPVFGIGPGTWGIRRAALTQPGETDVWLPHAHNVYAEALAEFGLLGIVAGLLVVWTVGGLILKAITDEDATKRRFGYAAGFTMTFFSVAALGDIGTDLPVVLFAVALPVAWLDAARAPGVRKSHSRSHEVAYRRTGLAVTWALGVAVTLSMILLLSINATALSAQRATDLANDGHSADAYAAAQQAAKQDPTLAVYQFLIGLEAARVGNANESARAFAASAAADDFAEAWLNLAALQLRLGRSHSAAASLERALRLGQQRATVAFPAGALWLQMSEPARAVDAFAQGLLAAPSLASDTRWWSMPEVELLRSKVVDRAIAEAPPETAFRIAVEAGELDRAAKLAAPMEGTDGGLSTFVLSAWMGEEWGVRGLAAMAQSQPLDTRVLAWCQRVSQHLGRWTEAQRYRRWLSIVDPAAEAILGRVARVSTSTSAPMPWSASGGYGAFVYGRPLPVDFGIPGLVGIDAQTCLVEMVATCR